MSLYETRDPFEPIAAPQKPDAIPISTESFSDKLEDAFYELISNVMTIREHQKVSTQQGVTFIYQGNLIRSAHEIFAELNEAVEAHGYTLYMQRRGDFDEILITEGVLEARNIRAPWWFHVGLLLATMITTLTAAAMLNGYTLESIQTAFSENNELVLSQIYRRSREFAWPLLLILGVHEMGHYIAARFHGLKVTLPFFIPLPIFGSLGTLGAVIFIKSPFRNRKQLFDVGIAGPLAGLIVALPLFLLGLEHSAELSLLPRLWLGTGFDDGTSGPLINRVSIPPLLEFIASLTHTENQVNVLDRSVFYNHPRALAAWFGVLLTSLNLLPMGQFDGGHIAFAVFGRRIAWPLSWFVAYGCAAVGLSGLVGLSNAWPIWFIWPLFALLTGLRHPPPHDDITPLGWPRQLLGIFTFMLLLGMIVIAPFYSSLG